MQRQTYSNTNRLIRSDQIRPNQARPDQTRTKTNERPKNRATKLKNNPEDKQHPRASTRAGRRTNSLAGGQTDVQTDGPQTNEPNISLDETAQD